MSSDSNKRAPRPIDPPSLPPWLSRSDLAHPEEEVTDQLPTPPASSLSPKEPEPPAPHPEPAPAPEDPRALAERLAREAKARLAAQKAAQEAARPQEPAPVEVASSEPAAEPAPAAPSASPPRPTSERPPSPEAPATEDDRGSLAERASKVKRPMTAAEALAAALKGADEPAPKARKGRKSRSRTKPKPAPAPAAAPPKTTPPPEPGAADIAKAVALTARLLPGAQLKGAPVPVANRDVFRAVWQAHRARALHDHDLDLVVTASVLLDAVDRLPPGALFAVDVAFQGDRHAVWLDTDRKTVLGVARPPGIYLTGG